MRSAARLAVVVVAASMAATQPARADLDTLMEFDMAEVDLTSALLAISRQGGIMISFPSEIATGQRAGAIRGRITVRDAILRVLAGKSLRMVPGTNASVTIVRVPGATAAADDDQAIGEDDVRQPPLAR